MTEPPTPETLRTYAALFDRMLPSAATTAAAAALRWQADEIERRGGNRVNGESQLSQVFEGRRL